MMGMSGRRMPGPPPSGGGGISEGESASIPLARGICAIFSPGRPSVMRALVQDRMGERLHYTIARSSETSSNEGNTDVKGGTFVPGELTRFPSREGRPEASVGEVLDDDDAECPPVDHGDPGSEIG